MRSNRYDSSKSSTFKAPNPDIPFSIVYGDGTGVIGTLVNDTVTVGVFT